LKRRISARDVALKRLNRLLLAGNDPLHQVSDGDDSDHRVILNHGQVPEVALGHQRHALVYRVFRAHGDDGAGHQLPDLGLTGGMAPQNAFTRVIPLRKDADQAIFPAHEQNTDVVLGQHFQRLIDRVIGIDGKHASFGSTAEQNADCVIDLHTVSPEAKRMTVTIAHRDNCREAGNFRDFSIGGTWA
jgi:hypothetical protein